MELSNSKKIIDMILYINKPTILVFPKNYLFQKIQELQKNLFIIKKTTKS